MTRAIFDKQPLVSLRNAILVIVPIILTTSFLLTSGCALVPNKIIEDITPQEAFDLIQENTGNANFIIIDVRTPEEFKSGRLEGAVNLDFYSEDFEANMDKLDKGDTYLVYCRTGNRSRNAVNIMERLGFRRIYHMPGGIIQWEASEYPVVR